MTTKSTCRHSEEYLKEKLDDCNYGQEKAYFDVYFVKNSEAHPRCRDCNRDIDAHRPPPPAAAPPPAVAAAASGGHEERVQAGGGGAAGSTTAMTMNVSTSLSLSRRSTYCYCAVIGFTFAIHVAGARFMDVWATKGGSWTESLQETVSNISRLVRPGHTARP